MAKRPNIVLIMTDDQGLWSLGCYGNREIRTPNIDRLAAEGVRFTNFFCASPVCSPARASILTGRIPSAHGVHDWIKTGNLREDGIDYLHGIEGYTDVLARNGYACWLSGKWHLGNSFVPQKGFTHWYAHQSGAGQYYNAPMVRDGQAVQEPVHVTDAITDDAIACIRQADPGQPFYLSVHYTAPHMPWDRNQYPERLRKLYENASFVDAPQEEPNPKALYVYSPEYARESLIGYYALVTGVDENVGRLIDALADRNLLEDTLVIFTSDNGYNFGHHGIWGKGNATSDLNMYDYSVKVPTIFYHKGRIAPSVSDAMLSHYDLFPTLLAYCGAEVPADPMRPGRSFADLFTAGHCLGDEQIIICDEYGPTRMIRTREWKYVHRYPHGDHELYHLTADPDERRNLYGDPACNAVLTELRGKLTDWFVRYTDPAIDGAREAVRGYGQLGLAGVHAHGKNAFAQNEKEGS